MMVSGFRHCVIMFSFFWDVTQRWLVVTEVSEQPNGSYFKGQAIQEDLPYINIKFSPIHILQLYVFLLRESAEML
jgi:hypothetical protein